MRTNSNFCMCAALLVDGLRGLSAVLASLHSGLLRSAFYLCLHRPIDCISRKNKSCIMSRQQQQPCTTLVTAASMVLAQYTHARLQACQSVIPSRFSLVELAQGTTCRTVRLGQAALNQLKAPSSASGANGPWPASPPSPKVSEIAFC